MSEPHTIENIENMPFDALCKLLAEKPRLLTKLIDLIRDEYSDQNLTDQDISDAWDEE